MTLGKGLQSVLKTARQQLRDHVDLWGLVPSLAGVGLMSLGIMAWSSAKPEVVFNRWKFVAPQDSVKWDQPQNRFVVFARDRKVYKDDPALRELLGEIYEDQRYKDGA